jgi:serine/threonine-protein kinase
MALTKIAGRYELQEQLGEGGMGVVWRALDTKTGSPVAIKVIRDISDPNAVELFAKEWRALAEMSHPNIVEVRDVDIIEENKRKKPFFVMPLLQGTTLAELIAHASARLTLGRVVEIITQVCKGLQAAHQRGLVHRDLKPSNIFVMDDYTAKIIDFGVVYLAGTKSTTGQKGTWQYMSPEQAQLKEITPASDIFSLGVVLYETLTLRKPFARATIEETVQAICKFIPPPVSEINPSVNEMVSRVVHKCLAKQPMHRFASASDLADALNKAYRNEPIFDPSKIQPRIERAKAAFKSGDDVFASEILAEVEAEGNLDPQITVLRTQIDLATKVKKIRHLLESARARMEQEEIPLALEKLREVLELDPGNADALAMRDAMEKQRNESQIAKWLELARTHLGNRDFAVARNAVQEVLAIRRGEPRALDLMEKIESTEQEAQHVRAQKEQLYNSALKAYQNDEIDTALSKLERLFAVGRSNPEAAVPERDAVYQSFYKEVRSERDNIQGAIEEAQHQFGNKNFAEALRVCKNGLAKHPGNGAFLALKIQIEDAERQQLSAYIAEVSKRVEAEFDLDRRANILREACERYPAETQFAQQLKVIRERRDLVNSVVAKARQLEERGQYSDALSQWDMLRNIHPQYPGLAFDLEQCKKQRDRQLREEEKSRAVEQIQRLMESRALAKALACIKAALEEFPGDPELTGLQKQAEEGLERIKESRRLLEEGQRAFAEKNLPQAAELLRNGLKLDPRFSGLRDALVNVLTEWARVELQTDWRNADPLYEEAKGLDPTHPAVRALRSSISEAKRQAAVTRCLTDARVLFAAGNAKAAFDLVRTARSDYPNDPRLEQYEATLLRESPELRSLAANKVTLDSPDRVSARVPAEPDQKIALGSSPEAGAAPAGGPEIERTISKVQSEVPTASLKPDFRKLQQLEATKVFQTGDEEKKKTSTLAVRFGAAQQAVLNFVRPGGQWAFRRLGGIAAGLVVIAVIAYFAGHRRAPTEQAQVQSQGASIPVQVATDPPDATVTLDSKPISGNTVQVPAGGTVTIEVSRLGYKTKAIQVTDATRQEIKLDPEPLHLSVETPEKEGAVELDDKKIGELSNGALEGCELPPDGVEHKLSVVARGRKLVTVGFQALPGAAPRLNPLTADDFLAVASLGPKATLYGGRLLRNVQLDDAKVSDVRSSGADLPPLTDQTHELKYGSAGEEGSVSLGITSAPALVIHSVSPEEQFLITSNVQTATLTVDGEVVKRQSHGWRVSRPPGLHHFVLAADGYKPQTWTMTMQPRQTIRKDVTLVAVAARPATSPVLIANGTTGSEVFLDGRKVGELDSAGNGQFRLDAAGARHVLILQKSGYESRTINFPTPQPPTPFRVANEEARLTQFGALAFSGAAKDLPLKFRRVGEPFQTTSAAGQLLVPAGKYEIVVDAPGFTPYKTQVTVRSGQPTAVNLSAAGPIPAVDDPAQVSSEAGWFKAKDPGKLVYLKPGAVNVNLVFPKPKSSFFAKSKILWTITSSDGQAEVQYELEDQKLSRKFILGGKTSDQKSGKVDLVSVTQSGSVSVHVQADNSNLRISNDKGEILDDCTVAGHDLSKGKVGIKTNSLFAVWANNR